MKIRKIKERKRRKDIRNKFNELIIELDILKIYENTSYLEILIETIKYIKELKINISFTIRIYRK